MLSTPRPRKSDICIERCQPSTRRFSEIDNDRVECLSLRFVVCECICGCYSELEPLNPDLMSTAERVIMSYFMYVDRKSSVWKIFELGVCT